MRFLKKIPFFLFLLALFFCLHGSVENYGYLDPGEVLMVGIVIIVCVAVLFLIILFFTKNHILASLISFFISGWYLFFGVLHDWIKSISFISFLRSYTILVPLLVVCTVVWIIFLKRNKQLQPKLLMYLNILLLLYCAFDSYLLLREYSRGNKMTTVQPVAFDAAKVSQKPNVYFMVFDEYAGYKSLKDSFAFANDSLYNFLQQNEFKVLPTHTNYEFTPFSISSIVNMQYVDSNYDHRLLAQKDVQQRFGEIRNGEVFSIFKRMGYTLENYSIFDIKDHPALSGSNPLFPIHHYLLTDKIFHNRAIKDLGWWFVNGRFEVPFIKEKYLYSNDSYNKKAEEMVLKSAAEKNKAPGFSYAHFFLPHDPYFRDSTGALNSPELILRTPPALDKPLYLSYLKYTNTVIRKLVKNIVADDPTAIIIILSDHGFYHYKPFGTDDPNNYDNICLVRFPHKNYLPYKEKWSTVNFFRYLFNCEFGQNMPYLKDSTIYVNK